jgi:hypothetical protein
VAVFKNKFFSKSGQVERLKNIAGVIKAPFTGGRVVSNTKNKTVNKVLEMVSNNPLKTAFVGGTVANIPKAVSVVKSAKMGRAAARAAAKANRKGGVIKPSSDGGLLDLNTLGRGSSTAIPPVAPSGGLIKPQDQTGGTIQSTTKSISPRSPKRKSTKRRSTKRRVRRNVTSRKRTRRSTRRSKRRIGTAAQYARKGGRSVKYAKNGRPYIILANGQPRFVKGKTRKRR